MKYDYVKEMKEDVKNYIKENADNSRYDFNNKEKLYESLYDDLWVDDSVTGNGSGSYTFNRYQAEENISHNMDLLKDACKEFEDDPFRLFENPEVADVTIRCYLLSQVISEVLDELENDKNEKIKVIKKVEYFKKGELIESDVIEKEIFYNETDAKNKIKNENLKHYYNNKAITVIETIETIVTSESGYSRLYKTIKPETGEVISNV